MSKDKAKKCESPEEEMDKVKTEDPVTEENKEQKGEPPVQEEEPKPQESEADLLKKELQAQKDILLRTAAEYENFRKRTEREKRAIYSDATAAAVMEIIPIADSLEFAVKAQDGAPEEYQKGLEMVNNQFQAALQKLGVTTVGEAGEEFNPELHNAVAHVEDETVADNIILEVFQKGYKLGDKVIRHAMVKVAN